VRVIFTRQRDAYERVLSVRASIAYVNRKGYEFFSSFLLEMERSMHIIQALERGP